MAVGSRLDQGAGAYAASLAPALAQSEKLAVVNAAGRRPEEVRRVETERLQGGSPRSLIHSVSRLEALYGDRVRWPLSGIGRTGPVSVRKVMDQLRRAGAGEGQHDKPLVNRGRGPGVVSSAGKTSRSPSEASSPAQPVSRLLTAFGTLRLSHARVTLAYTCSLLPRDPPVPLPYRQHCHVLGARHSHETQGR